MKKQFILSMLYMGMLFIPYLSFAQCEISGPSTVTTNFLSQFSTNEVPGASYFWSVSGSIAIGGPFNTNPEIYVYGTQGHGNTGRICVTRFQAGQDPCCECTEVTVVPPCFPATDVEISSDPEDACPGDEIVFTANLSPFNVTLSQAAFEWTGGTGSPGSTPIVSQSGGNTFTWATPSESLVWVTVTYTSCDGTTVSDTEIISCCIPATGIEIEQVEVSGDCPGDVIEFQVTFFPANATVGNGDFIWQGGEGFVFGQNVLQTQTGGSSFFFETPESGQAWVGITYTACDGSTVTAFNLVQFSNDCFGSGIPGRSNMSNPNNKSLIKAVSPNPFSEKTTLEFDLKKSGSIFIEIHDLKGKVLFSKKDFFEEGNNRIEIKDLPEGNNGILFYRISTEEGIIETGNMLRSK